MHAPLIVEGEYLVKYSPRLREALTSIGLVFFYIWSELETFTLEDRDNSISSCASSVTYVTARVVYQDVICVVFLILR